MNFHRGAPIQQGAGLGSMFSGLFRALMPAARTAARTLGKVAKSDIGKYAKMEATRSAVDTALEALEGKPVGAAAKRRLKTATKNILLESKRKLTPNNRGRGRGAKRKQVDQVPLFDDVDDDDSEDEYENMMKAGKRTVWPNNRGWSAKRKNVKFRVNKFKRRKVKQDQVPLFDDVDDVDYEDEYNRKIYHTKVL